MLWMIISRAGELLFRASQTLTPLIPGGGSIPDTGSNVHCLFSYTINPSVLDTVCCGPQLSYGRPINKQYFDQRTACCFESDLPMIRWFQSDTSLPARLRKVGSQSTRCISCSDWPELVRRGLRRKEAPLIPPSYIVSLVPFRGELEYQGPPPLSVVTNMTLLLYIPLSFSFTITLSIASSTLARTMSLRSCGLSSKVSFLALLLIIFLNFLGGTPTNGVWTAMKAR